MKAHKTPFKKKNNFRLLTNAEGIHTQQEVSNQRIAARTRTKTSTRGGDEISRNYTIVDREMFG